MRKYPSPADVEEMRRRGYDPSTIAEAEKQSARWRILQDVRRLVIAAFAGVTLGEGVGLYEGQAIDDYANDREQAKCRERDEKENWERIPTERLRECNSSLSFFDDEGMRFHLPAFILADLDDKFGFDLAYSLSCFDDYRQRQFSLLSQSQRDAVRSYLEFMREEPEAAFNLANIDRALAEYWSV